jgi:hypothetical protein
MSESKQQSKHTRRREEGSQYYHLLQVQAERTLHMKMRREKYYEHFSELE